MSIGRWPRKMLWLWLFLLIGAPVGLEFFSRISFIEPPLAWRPLSEPGQVGATVSLTVSPHDPRRLLSGGDMLRIAVSDDAGESWQQPTGLRGYEIADTTWHPSDGNVAWTGSASGP